MIDDFLVPQNTAKWGMLGPGWSFFGIKLVGFGIEHAFFEVRESSISFRCTRNRFSKACGADAGQPEGHSVS